MKNRKEQKPRDKERDLSSHHHTQPNHSHYKDPYGLSELPASLDRRQLLLILDSIDEPVYISDPRTHCLIYTNEAFRKRFSDWISETCYQALCGLDSPCPICQNEFIFQHKPGKVYIWEYQHGLNKLWYRLIGRALYWDDESLVCAGIAIDITQRVLAVKALQENEATLQERNRIIEEDLRVAQKIQRALLPNKPVSNPHIQLDYRYYPLDAVGGDFFSFASLEQNSLGVFIGDVTGHGVSAALFLSLVKFTTDRLISSFAFDPTAFMENFNKEIKGQLHRSFVTAIFGCFQRNQSGCSFSFSRGGHPYPIFYNAATGRASFLESPGIVVGIFDDIGTQTKTVTLKKGDRIFLYTDGLFEKRLAAKTYPSDKRIISIIEKAHHTSLSTTLDNIIHSSNAFYDFIPPQDDIVLIGAECSI